MADGQERADRVTRLMTECQETHAYGGDYNDVDIHDENTNDRRRNKNKNENKNKNAPKDEEAAIARPPPSYSAGRWPSHAPARIPPGYSATLLPPSYNADQSPPSYFSVFYGTQSARRDPRKRCCSLCCMLLVLAAIVFAAVIGSMVYFYGFYMEQPQELMSESQVEQQLGGHN